MAKIPVSQLKAGAVLAHDVLTQRNNVLFIKGRVVSDKDLEVLMAFLIPAVEVADGDEAQTSVQSEARDNGGFPSFEASYDQMLQLLKRVFAIVDAGGEALPVLDVRNGLEELVSHADSYHALHFSPKHFQMPDFIYHNSIMVSLTSYCMARWIGLASKDFLPVALAGLLHDIGNARIDPAILFKPDRLSVDEMDALKKHTVIGYQMLRPVPAINEGVKLAALQHHEREDGSGYPLGVRGDKIHLYSKIVAVADMFHAMTTSRFHKSGTSPYLALEQLQAEAFGKLDPHLVSTFIERATQFHHGTIVRLSDNRIGEIVFSDRSYPTRPWVNVSGSIVNLIVERNLYIQEVIQK